MTTIEQIFMSEFYRAAVDDPPVTDWYPCTVKPKRKGFYEVKRMRLDGTTLDHKRHYFGVKWKNGNGWISAIIETQDFWRGLAKKP